MAVVNSSAGYAQKQAQLKQLVDTNVDVAGVAHFVLGRFWRVATPEQQQDYMQTFRQLLVYAVTGQASTFQGASFTVGQAVQRDVGIVVDTTVNVPGKTPTTVQWVVATIDGQPKIIDIIAEGTSLRLTERNDYAGVISQHGGQIQPLINAMRGQLARFEFEPDRLTAARRRGCGDRGLGRFPPSWRLRKPGYASFGGGLRLLIVAKMYGGFSLIP